jgi:phosphatidylinositol-3-phosphatase
MGSSGTVVHASVPSGQSDASSGPATVPRYAHIVLVVMENHSQAQILGSSSAPFLRELGSAGLTLTNSTGAGEPSEPNYLALFSGSTHGLSSDACPKTFTGPNLASELADHGLSFTGYSEGLPAAGYTGCSAGSYARKHNPWVDYPSLPASVNQPFSAFPESDFTKLPTVTIVVPDLAHDMHDGTIAAGDSWLCANLGAYSEWALHNNSLLIVTWDESGSTVATRIPTVLYGARLESGTDRTPVTHTTSCGRSRPHTGCRRSALAHRPRR